MKKLNWKERIELAKKRGKFTKEDEDKSYFFKTCAIGEKYKLDLDKNEGLLDDFNIGYFGLKETPELDKAELLGIKFYRKVKSNNIKQAQQIYNKIQKLK